ncbi:MAG: hypothetical protein ACRDPJ_00590, partial [Nocardioidaceae bacterium]
SDTEQYCDTLRERKDDLGGLAEQAGKPGSDVFADTLDIFKELRDEAPGDVVDEWDTLVFAWEGLTDAFERAGVTPGEYDPAHPPEDVSTAEAEALEDAASDLASQRVIDAGDGIEQHAQDVCKVDLGL